MVARHFIAMKLLKAQHDVPGLRNSLPKSTGPHRFDNDDRILAPLVVIVKLALRHMICYIVILRTMCNNPDQELQS
jgi:hypothetical protein